jgi:hypothetical protein
VQEEHLTRWILTQGGLGYAPTHAQIKHFAARILAIGGDTQPLGQHWIQHFLARNPAVRTIQGKRIEALRLNGASTENIQLLFRQLNDPTIHNIEPHNRWNMDETGIMEGYGINGLVVGAKELKSINVTSSKDRTWTTIVECVSATGQSLNPLVIFKGGSVQQQWFPRSGLTKFDGWHFTSSDNGWTNNEIGVKWLQDVFIPESKPVNPYEARLLVVDGHGSHVTDEFMFQCFTNNIYMLFLPAHSSHVLQPLDLSIFSPLKTAYRRWIGTLLVQTDTSPIGKQSFLMSYEKARTDAITPSNIKGGWKATGLWPISMRKPLMSRQLLPPPSTPANNPPATPQVSFMALQQGTGEGVRITTPKKSAEVRSMVQELQVAMMGSTARVLFRKIGKGLDAKNFQLAEYQHRVQQLEQQVESLRPQKRKRVVENPNERFVRIEQVMQVKALLTREAEAQAEVPPNQFEDMLFEFQL